MHEGGFVPEAGIQREEIQCLLWRSSFSSWGERQRNSRFLEWGNGFRGMEPGQSKDVLSGTSWSRRGKGNGNTWDRSGRLSEGVWTSACINQSITSYWFYPLDISPIHPWPLPCSDTHHISPGHWHVFEPSPFCCKSWFPWFPFDKRFWFLICQANKHMKHNLIVLAKSGLMQIKMSGFFFSYVL